MSDTNYNTSSNCTYTFTDEDGNPVPQDEFVWSGASDSFTIHIHDNDE